MSDVEAQDRKEASPAPKLLRPTFSPWFTIIAMAFQTIICGLTWAFVGLMIHRVLPLRDNLANLVRNNPIDTNMLITVMSTVLGLIGTSLLGITVQHALLFRLPRGVRLSVVAPWVQIARSSLFLRSRRHLWWTLLSVVWLAVTHFLTTAWSNLLTPVAVYRNYNATGREIDLLKPAVSDLLLADALLPYVTPAGRNFSLTPVSFGFLANITGYLAEAGGSATTAFLDPGYPSFVGQFNSSTGGVNPAPPQVQLPGFPTLPDDYQGLSTTYTFNQQGFTADISCRASSSPTITLDNSDSVAHTFETASGPFDYTLETWSWSTNCSGNGAYSTGEVNLLASNDTVIGNGLFATSVCFYQDFSGPSNQSFLVLMRSPNNSGYNETYFAANPNLTTVCEFTPMVTTVEVQYNSSSGLANVNRVLGQTPLPDNAYALLSIEGFSIWALYLLAQGPYSNSFADAPLELVQLVGPQFNGDPSLLLTQYQRGIFEYMGSVIRGSIESNLQDLPDNLTTQISGTMSVQTLGWRYHPRTHSVAMAVLMLITIATLVSGTFALWEASQEFARHPSETGGVRAFNPTNLTDFLLASSVGNLSEKLSQCKDEDSRENLRIGLAVTNGGHCVLDAH